MEGEKAGEDSEGNRISRSIRRNGDTDIWRFLALLQWKWKIISWKTPSLEIKCCPTSRFNKLYPFFLLMGHPMKTHGWALCWNISLPFLDVNAKHKQPKDWKWWYVGSVSYRNSKGDLECHRGEGNQLIWYPAFRIESPNIFKGTFTGNTRSFDLKKMLLFPFSNPILLWVSVQLVQWRISFSRK